MWSENSSSHGLLPTTINMANSSKVQISLFCWSFRHRSCFLKLSGCAVFMLAMTGWWWHYRSGNKIDRSDVLRSYQLQWRDFIIASSSVQKLISLSEHILIPSLHSQITCVLCPKSMHCHLQKCGHKMWPVMAICQQQFILMKLQG